MKTITYVLLALLICATFIGTGSAFTALDGRSSIVFTVEPTGSLSPNDIVTASTVILLSANSMADASDSLTVYTDLYNAHCKISVYKGNYKNEAIAGIVPTTTIQSSVSSLGYALPAFSIGYTKDASTLRIVVTGTVSENSKGKSITVLKILQGGTPSGELSTASTQSQYVYNPDDFSGNVALADEKIASLESRISTYIGYGIDVSEVTTKLQSAKISLAAAKSAGTADISVASKNLEAATTSLSAGEKALSLMGINKIQVNINEVNAIIKELQNKGWYTNKVTNLKSDNTDINTDVISYKSLGTPFVDDILIRSETAVSSAHEYQVSANSSPLSVLGSVLPIIIVIVVAVVVVVGAIVFIRRRRGGWDELG